MDAVVRNQGIALGIGLQIANIVRDVAEDAARDRIYLPQEDLARFGVTESEVIAGQSSDRMRALLKFEATRARTQITDGLKLVPTLPRHARPFPLFLGRVYARILDRIEARDYDVFSGKVALTGGEKVALLMRTFAGAFT